jgi:thioesterase domain-containing protein/acyl carrier protein
LPDRFARQLREMEIATVFLTTALFNVVAREEPTAFAPLREVLFGGEACDPNSVARILETGPPRRLLHVYGPTECTTFATAHLVTQLGAGARTVPIGLPIANTTAYVLGPEMQPVPVGVPGELYLGGHGLAHGYLGQPELTATSFVDDPFRPQAGERLYRTGDLVRRHGDASIEFIGRLDKQIKLRGFRIEPGEIEAVLLKQDGVRDAVVVPLKGEADKDLQLVAYVVPDSQPGPSEDTLRAELKLYLPSFMLPTNLVTLKELPLNANGKVDRTRLPKPAPRRPDPGTGGAKPVNAVEQALAEIWAEVLGVDSVPADADFFALGGHSLLATRLLSEVESRFNVRLPLSKLFEQPTVRGVATTLKNDNWGAQWKSLVPVNAKGNRRPFFCVHGDPSALAPHLDADQPYYWLHHAQDGSLVGYATVEEIATDHLKEIRTVQPHGPYLLGGFSFGGLLAFEITRELRQAGERVDLLAMFDPPHPPLPQNIKAQLKTIGKRKQPAVRRMVGAIKMRFRRITGSIKHLLGSLQISLAMVSGKPLPTDIRTEYLVRIFRSASRQYGYAPIPGSATIFVHGGGYATDTGRMRLQAAWESVTKEPVDLRIIPEVPTHGALFQEPYVGRLAAELNALLEASQVEQPDAGPGQ